MGRVACSEEAREGRAGTNLAWGAGSAALSTDPPPKKGTAVAALCLSSSTSTLQLWASCALASQNERQPEGAVGAGSPRTTSGFMSMRCRKARAKARLDTSRGHLSTSSSTCGHDWASVGATLAQSRLLFTARPS